jgi:hypothetical protein
MGILDSKVAIVIQADVSQYQKAMGLMDGGLMRSTGAL